ncbi:hypothetical protein RUM44_007590 [Polyplax serrata]|uniref:type I protein arginine methyltransferase n=1 Tax=Polyplax serrata TaxID=468196 RepID=A0ABR1B6Y0_POLSC
MASTDGAERGASNAVYFGNVANYAQLGNDIEDDDGDDENEETWEEMEAEYDSYLTCLFCNQNFKTMAVALEHCKVDHNFNLSNLKSKFSMDCYSYICMINYVRREKISSEMLMSFKEPPWLNGEYLTPVIQDDPWLMFDFDGFESPIESRSLTPEQNYHVVNSENGLVTLTEQHFAQLQYKIKHLTLQVQKREEALSLATEQIHKMKAVTHNLVCNDVEDQEIEKQVKKSKLLGDNGYFGSYSHFGIHLEMLSDKVRTNMYRNAIVNNASVIADKIVLDVGCGTGILSMFATSAGAKKVYGVDKSEIIFSAMDIVRENHLFDKIHLIHAKVEDAVLPVDSVDIIISEWMGYFLLYEGMLDSVITARNKYLSPGGRILPNRCALYVVGISDTASYDNFVGFWSNVYGFKMSCLAKEVIQEAQIFNMPGTTVATSAATVLNLDLHTATIESTNFASDFCLECTIDGRLTALCGYFDAFFDLPNSVVLSTSPKSGKTHWKQTIFFLQNPLNINKGSVINGRMSCKKSADDDRALTIAITLEGHEKMEYFLP